MRLRLAPASFYLATIDRENYCCVPLCNENARIHIDLSKHHIPLVKTIELHRKCIVPIRRDEGPYFNVRHWMSLGVFSCN